MVINITRESSEVGIACSEWPLVDFGVHWLGGGHHLANRTIDTWLGEGAVTFGQSVIR